jgi:hypothetical protein
MVHVGDGEVSDDLIYVPLACLSWETTCGGKAAYAIGIYAAHTAGLPLLKWKNITSSGCDASGVAAGPDKTLYVASYFVHPDQICLFDAKTLESKGTLLLSIPLPRIQGISYNAAAQQFAVTVDDADRHNGYVYFISLSGEVTGPVYSLMHHGELEGLDYTQGYIGYNIASHIYYLFPAQVTGSNFEPGAEVMANGRAQQTTYVDSGNLRVMIEASSLKSFGDAPIKVMNPGLHSGASSELKLVVKESGK